MQLAAGGLAPDEPIAPPTLGPLGHLRERIQAVQAPAPEVPRPAEAVPTAAARPTDAVTADEGPAVKVTVRQAGADQSAGESYVFRKQRLMIGRERQVLTPARYGPW